jgi:serine phosphatase RsbU (regulator of sigma subunit)
VKVLVRGSAARPLDRPAGILLGASTDEYGAATIRLAADDLLLLYSDGLIERKDRSIDDGVAALTRTVRGIDDPEQAIAAALDAQGCTEPDDDTCLVAIRVL